MQGFNDRMPWSGEGVRHGFWLPQRFVVERRDPRTGAWTRVGEPMSLHDAQARMDEALGHGETNSDLRIERERRTWARRGAMVGLILAVVLVVFVTVRVLA